MTVAMILSAGLGTRLRPLTDELPKPLVPVGDKPAIRHIQDALAAAGLRQQIVNTHHRAAAFSADVLLPGTVVVTEPSILGTSGGVANARASFDGGPVLVWNGDILAPIDVSAALARLAAADHPDAVWIVAPRPVGQGTVGLDADGHVCRVRTFRRGEEHASGDFLGVSALSPQVVAALPGEGCLVGDVFGPRLAELRVATVLHAGAWDDLGSPAAYLAANQRWLRERGLSRYLGPGAQAPEGTTGIVGAGAVLTGKPALDVVCWPHARADEVPPRTVVTTAGLRVTVA